MSLQDTLAGPPRSGDAVPVGTEQAARARDWPTALADAAVPQDRNDDGPPWSS